MTYGRGEAVFVYYDQPAGTFYWVGSYIGTAGRRSTGTDQGNLAVLGTGGRFAAAQLPNDVVYRAGTTFTGAVSGITPTADENFATKEYVDAADGPYYPIADSNVGGTRDDVTLNTTQSLTAYVQGMMVFFEQGSQFNGGDMSINVDGLGQRAFRKSDGEGGQEEFALGDIQGNQLVLAVFDFDGNQFVWLGGNLGSASTYNAGELEGQVVLLGTGGRVPRGRLPGDIAYEDGATFTGAVSGPTPTADEHLTTKAYVDLNSGGAGGDITSIITATTSGLAGGAVSGDVTLSIDLSALTALSDSEISANDLFLVRDDSTGTDRNKTISKGDFALGLITGDTLSVSPAGNLHVSDEGIAEEQMDIANSPTLGYVIGWNGTRMEWQAEGVTPTPAHTSYTTTSDDVVFSVADFTGARSNSGTGNILDVVDWTGSFYAGFARPVSAGVITELYFYAQGAGRGNNQIGAWTIETQTLNIIGEDHYVIRSDGPLTAIAGISITIEVA